MKNNNYICTLIHGDECENNNDCENCNYGIDEKFLSESKTSTTQFEDIMREVNSKKYGKVKNLFRG